MKNILFCLSFLCLTSVAFAGTKSNDGHAVASSALKVNSDSYYQQVKDMFTSEFTIIPTFARDEHSAHIGRCYRTNNPNTPIAGGYLVSAGSDDGSHGPIGENETLVGSIWSLSESADHFDNLSSDKLFETAKLYGASIDYDVSGLIMSTDGLTSILRQYHDYYVEEVTFDDSEVTYCYYFIHK